MECKSFVDFPDQLLESLPKNVGDVGCYGETVSDEVRVTEMRTLSLPFEYSKETLPVFLLPGIKADSLVREKFRNSIYPTFLVEPPHLGSSSLEELSSYVMPVRYPKPGLKTRGLFVTCSISENEVDHQRTVHSRRRAMGRMHGSRTRWTTRTHGLQSPRFPTVRNSG